MLVGAALLDVVELIRSANVEATDDARSLTLPGALVMPGSIAFDRLDADDYSLDVEVYLVVGDHGTSIALDQLGEMLESVRNVLGVGSAEPVTLNLINHASDPLPAFKLTATVSVTH